MPIPSQHEGLHGKELVHADFARDHVLERGHPLEQARLAGRVASVDSGNRQGLLAAEPGDLGQRPSMLALERGDHVQRRLVAV